MRELNDTEKQQLEQHKLWLASNGKEGARLVWSGANLRGAYLYEANLRGANLYRANLYEANLYRANLYEANLYEANLCGANLCGANLYRANLYEANLYRACMCEANLYGADLCMAGLYGTNLRGANLYGACMCGAKGIRVITPDGSRGDMLKATIHADGWHIYTGCFGGTLAEFEKAVERDHANDKWGVLYRADIAMLRATEQVFLDEITSSLQR